MPELPEVEVVRRGLERWVSGRTIDTVEVHHPRAIRRHTAGAADFAARLKGLRLGVARRRGKYLWLPVTGAARPRRPRPKASARSSRRRSPTAWRSSPTSV